MSRERKGNRTEEMGGRIPATISELASSPLPSPEMPEPPSPKPLYPAPCFDRR